MGRKNRIVFKNAVYHVINRGNRGNEIFLTEGDRYRFLQKLGEFSEEYKVDIFSYVLMNNHYHLLLRTNLPNLPVFMQRFSLTYTKYFNYTHGANGHLFQDRYRSFLVDTDKYFLAVLKYIALNPVVAGIVSDAGKYIWGSYRFLFEGGAPDWLKLGDALSLADLTRNDYRLIVEFSAPRLDEFLEFESHAKLTEKQIDFIISTIKENLGLFEENKKIEVLIYYLLSLGANQRYLAEYFSISPRTLRRIFSKVSKELSAGNRIYLDILNRIKSVLLVPGTKRTKMRKNVSK